MATTVKPKEGRRYSVDASGITTLKREYIVVQDAVMTENGEVVSFSGVPVIGSVHPNHPGLYADTYDVEEQTGKDKKLLKVTVNYAPHTYETNGTGSDAVTCVVDEWGWDDGTDERELITDVDGVAVLNSAGDPFESVPKVLAPAPVFTKVMRFAERQSGWQNSRCKVNSAAVTIGGATYPIASLLCTVAESRIIGDEHWKYKYTVHLKYKSNLVKIEGSNSATDIGWDCAVTDAGMRELDENDEPRLIRMIDKETGKNCTVTSPALLDGSGARLADGDDPYNFRYKAYERASFPSWFYSEPTLAEEGLT